MNRSTRTLLRASVLAPVAVALAFGAAPAEADSGPVAQLAQDVEGAAQGVQGALSTAQGVPGLAGQGVQGVPGATGQGMPGKAATLLDPIVKGPVATTDGVFRAAQGTAAVDRAKGAAAQEATAELLKGVVNTAGADMIFSGIAAKCHAAADGTVRAATRVVGGKLTGAVPPALSRTPAIPARPPVNFKVPTGDPKTTVILNKQLRDPLGGATVSALSIIKNGSAGAAREFGVARCRPVDKAGKLATGSAAALAGKAGKVGKAAELTGGARRSGGDPVTGLLGSVTNTAGQALPMLGSLGNPQVAVPASVGNLAGRAGSALPVDPGRLTGAGGPAAPAMAATAPGGPVSGLTSNLSSLLGGLPQAPVSTG